MEDIRLSDAPDRIEDELTQSLQKMDLENILDPQPDQPSQTPQRRGKEVSIGHHYMAYTL